MALHLLTPPRLHPSSAPASSAPLRASTALAHPLLLSRLRLTTRTATPSRPRRRAMSTTVRSSLIDPDGGALVDLVATPDRRAALRAEAEALPRVRLAPVDVGWAHVLAEGWASPLRGFMREHEYLQCLHFNCVRLPDGAGLVNMSLPIVLAIGDREKEDIGDRPDVALVGPNGDHLAILRRCPDPPRPCALGIRTRLVRAPDERTHLVHAMGERILLFRTRGEQTPLTSA